MIMSMCTASGTVTKDYWLIYSAIYTTCCSWNGQCRQLNLSTTVWICVKPLQYFCQLLPMYHLKTTVNCSQLLFSSSCHESQRFVAVGSYLVC